MKFNDLFYVYEQCKIIRWNVPHSSVKSENGQTASSHTPVYNGQTGCSSPHQCTTDRLHYSPTPVYDGQNAVPLHQCTMDCSSPRLVYNGQTAVPQDWCTMDRLQFPKTGVQWTDCSSPRLVYNGQTAVPQDWCTKDRLHLAHTCTYDAGAVIKEAEALGEMQQCRLLLQQQVRGSAAVSVAVTTAGQGKCSSVGCCYNSRSGEMQQCWLLLQQQVRGNAAVLVAVTTAGRVHNQEELPVRGSGVPEWHVGQDRNQATLQAAGETGANELQWEA